MSMCLCYFYFIFFTKFMREIFYNIFSVLISKCKGRVFSPLNNLIFIGINYAIVSNQSKTKCLHFQTFFFLIMKWLLSQQTVGNNVTTDALSNKTIMFGAICITMYNSFSLEMLQYFKIFINYWRGYPSLFCFIDIFVDIML